MTPTRNSHLPAVILLLERMALTDSEDEAIRVRSAIQLVGPAPADASQSIADTPFTDSPAIPADDAADAITDENMATLSVLRELPVTHVIVDGQIRHQKTYLGTTFDVPKPNAAGPFYLITRGRRVGIFSSLQRANPHVQGVSLASHCRMPSLDAALLGIADAILHSEVNLVD